MTTHIHVCIQHKIELVQSPYTCNTFAPIQSTLTLAKYHCPLKLQNGNVNAYNAFSI